MKHNLIEIVLKAKGFTQAKLAKELGVSPGQISKWKAGEDIPYDRSRELIKLADLFDSDPDWAVFSGTEENAQAWIDYVMDLNNGVAFMSEPLEFDAPTDQISLMLTILSRLGINFPDVAPPLKYQTQIDIGDEDLLFDKLILNFLEQYGGLMTWINQYLYSQDLDVHSNDIHSDIFEIHYEINACAKNLALYYVDINLLEANKADIDKINREHDELVNYLSKKIFKMCQLMDEANLTIRTDYFDVVNHSPATLAATADEDEFIISPQKTIDDLLSYGEKEIRDEAKVQTYLLNEINTKLDKLLAAHH